MRRITQIGTIVQLEDGRFGTVVYNGLDGVGIKWGKHSVTEKDICGYGGLGRIGVTEPAPPPDYAYYPDAMLREPYEGADLPCVGIEYEIVN